MHHEFGHRVEREFAWLGYQHITGAHEQVGGVDRREYIRMVEHMDTLHDTGQGSVSESSRGVEAVEVKLRHLRETRHRAHKRIPETLMVADVYEKRGTPSLHSRQQVFHHTCIQVLLGASAPTVRR